MCRPWSGLLVLRKTVIADTDCVAGTIFCCIWVQSPDSPKTFVKQNHRDLETVWIGN